MASTPTLIEMVIAGHFQSPLVLSVLDLADWVRLYRDDFPTSQQLPISPRMELPQVPSFAPVPFLPFPGFNFVPGGELPRMLLSSPSSQLRIQLQADRIAVGWARIGPVGEEEDYPGFEQMMAFWGRVTDKFASWQQAQFGNIPSIRLAELDYNNGVLLEREGKPRRISDIFRWVQPDHARTVRLFGVNWGEVLSEEPEPAIVTAQAGLGQTSSGERMFAFNFAGLARADGPSMGPVAASAFDRLHERITEMFASAYRSQQVE